MKGERGWTWMRWYFGGKMMSEFGLLRRHGKCVTEMNVVYKIADSTSFLPDSPSHLWLNLFKALFVLILESIIYFKLLSLPKFCLTTMYFVMCQQFHLQKLCFCNCDCEVFSLGLLAQFQHSHLMKSSLRAQGLISWTKLLLCVQHGDGDQVIPKGGIFLLPKGEGSQEHKQVIGESRGMAGGRDGCLEVTSEQSNEAQREKRTVGRWMAEIDGWRQRCEEDKNTGGEERGERGCFSVQELVWRVKGLFYFQTPFSLTSVLKLNNEPETRIHPWCRV